MKIGFLGFGNMAQAIAKGLLLKKSIKAEQIYACAKNWDKLCENTKACGFIPCKDSHELVKNVDLVVIAVKPDLVEEVIEPIKGDLVGKVVISVVVNYTFDKYEKILLASTHHISTLPNIPVSVGEGIILYEEKHTLTEEEFKCFNNLFSNIALVEKVDTKKIGIAGIISGCGPAFASMFIEALSDAAVLHGLPRNLSYKLASQMLIGTGTLQAKTQEHPGKMKDNVCSPGGTTIVGVTTLERKGFRAAVIDGINEIISQK